MNEVILVNWGLGNPAFVAPKAGLDAYRLCLKRDMHYKGYARPKGVAGLHWTLVEYYNRERVSLKYDEQYEISPNLGISSMGTRVFLGNLLLHVTGLRAQGQSLVVAGPEVRYPGHVQQCRKVGAVYLPIEQPGLTFIQAVGKRLEAGEKIDVIVASSVYNPTGEVMSQSDMELAVKLVNDNKGIYLFIDGAYRQLYRPESTPLKSIFSIPSAMETQRIVETISASKMFQWPAIRTGALITHPNLAAYLNGRMQDDTDGGSPSGQFAFAACLEDSSYVQDLRIKYADLLGYTTNRLRHAGWVEVPAVPAPGMFIWAQMPKAVLDAGWTDVRWCAELKQKHGIVITPGSNYHSCDKMVRLAPKGSRANIRTASKIIGSFL